MLLHRFFPPLPGKQRKYKILREANEMVGTSVSEEPVSEKLKSSHSAVDPHPHPELIIKYRCCSAANLTIKTLNCCLPLTRSDGLSEVFGSVCAEDDDSCFSNSRLTSQLF